MPSITYNTISTSCPALQVSSATLNPRDPNSNPTTFSQMTVGASGPGSQSIPIRSIGVSGDLLGRHGGGGVAVATGLVISNVGTTLTISAGTAMIDGPVVLATAWTGTATLSTTVYYWISQGGTVNTTSTTTPNAGVQCFLGAVTCNGSTVTVLDGSGRYELASGGLRVHFGDAGAPAYTPPASAQVFAITAGGNYQWNGASWNGWTDSQNVKASSTDTTAAYLDTKLAAGSGITLTKLNAGANESFSIASAGTMFNSGTDTTRGFLSAKLAAGTGITLSTLSGGGNESLSIAVSPSAILDGKVKNSSGDTTSNYLSTKLVAGSGITLTTNNSGANETLTLSTNGQLLISSGDTTRNYLFNKLTAANGSITITKTGAGANEGMTIQANAASLLDYKAKCASTDSTADYLSNKIVAQNSTVTVGHANIGGNETVTVQANPAAILDGKVKAGSASTADYLSNVLVAGTGITLTPSTSTITISASGGGGGGGSTITISPTVFHSSTGTYTVTFSYMSGSIAATGSTFTGRFWLSDSATVPALTSTAPATGAATGANGYILSNFNSAKKEYTYVTDASTGTIQFTVQHSSSNTYYIWYQNPDSTVGVTGSLSFP